MRCELPKSHGDWRLSTEPAASSVEQRKIATITTPANPRPKTMGTNPKLNRLNLCPGLPCVVTVKSGGWYT